MSNLLKPTIGFVGMTHLGIVSATAVAGKGFSVVCYDENSELIKQLNQLSLPIEEPGLLALLQANSEKQKFTNELTELKVCDVIYVAIDVATDANNQSDLSQIQHMLQLLKIILSPDQVLVMLSQVPPGFTRALKLPTQQVIYQVETLIFGRALERASYPERYIVGCADPTKPLPETYLTLLEAFDCPILPMYYESAELAKISINMYLISSVMTSNMLAEMCTKVGAQWQEIVPALQLDKRIGCYAYLQPGLGVAGGNLERDMMTLVKQAKQSNANIKLIETWLENNLYYRNWVARCLVENILPEEPAPNIAILGLTYKPNTHSIKNSPVLHLLPALKNYTVKVHDPVVKPDITSIKCCDTISAAIKGADVLTIMTAWKAYKDLQPTDLLASMHGRWIIDPLRVLDHAAFIQAGFKVFTLGAEYSTLTERSCANV